MSFSLVSFGSEKSDRPIKYDPDYDELVIKRNKVLKEKEEEKKGQREVDEAVERASVWLKKKILSVNPSKYKKRFFGLRSGYDGWCRKIYSTRHRRVKAINYYSFSYEESWNSYYSFEDDESPIELLYSDVKKVRDNLEEMVFENEDVVKYMKNKGLIYCFKILRTRTSRFGFFDLQLLIYWSEANPLKNGRENGFFIKSRASFLNYEAQNLTC